MKEQLLAFWDSDTIMLKERAAAIELTQQGDKYSLKEGFKCQTILLKVFSIERNWAWEVNRNQKQRK